MLKITEILPRYTLLNSIVDNIINRKSIQFEELQFCADFLEEFNDIQAFETMLISLMMQADTEQQQILIKSLSHEIQNNIRLISSNKNVLENLDIKRVCEKFANEFEAKINNQLQITQEHWKELSEVNNSLDMIGFRAHTEIEKKRLWDKHERLSEKYNSEKTVLNEWYEKQKGAQKTAKKYREYYFPKILSLSEKLTVVIGKYLPQNQPTPQSGIYFDMAIISAIHKECNDEQFEDISEIDLYAVLNLLPSTGKLTIKNGERNRIYYLIHKLYEHLPRENNQMWRTSILQSLNLNERIYQSKYRIAKGSDATPELVEFAKRMDELFKTFSL